MVELRISEEDFQRIRGHLDRASPDEDGGFAVIGAVQLSNGEYALTVREVLLPQPHDWLDKGEHWLTPTTEYINRAVMRADFLHAGVLVFHSHPHPHHPADFSAIDRRSTKLLFANLAQLLPGAPLSSLVFTPNSFAGVAQINGGTARVRKMTRLGPRIRTDDASGGEEGPGEPVRSSSVHDRQVRALGPNAQRRIKEARVVVVGAGGTGSAVLEQLARLGVEHVTVIDDDHLDETNVSRVYGSTLEDALAGRSKVEVARDHYLRIQPNARIDAINASIVDPRLQRELTDATIIFGCTDTDSSRAVLNDIAYQCFVPVLDTGCKVDIHQLQLRGMLGRVRYLRPGLPCLWCTGTIDGRRVLHETLSPEERESLAASGYGSNLGPQPMLIQLTSTVASLAVNEFLRLVAEAGRPHDGAYLMLDLNEPSIQHLSARIDPECRCQQTLGRGHVLAGPLPAR